jgi:hypothetical protein
MDLVVRLLLAMLLAAPFLDGRHEAGPNVRPSGLDERTAMPHAPDDPPSILPLPQEYEYLEGVLRLPVLRSIVLGRGTTEGDRFAAGLIQEELRRLDVALPIDYEGPETSDSGSIVIRPAEGEPEGGYRLHVSSSGASIEASGERGRFYGAMSLLQLMRGSGPNVPALRVVDYPELSLRGLLDEIGHQLPTLQEFKRIIRFLGEHKMNVYALPLEQVFRFGADRTAGMGSVSPHELVELQDFAASYHVDIVPVFRTLGRFDRLLRLPEFSGLAEFPGAAAPNTQDPAAYELMETLLDEIVPVFRSKYLHIGGGMSDEIGVGASAAAVEREGTAVVHLRHYRRIYELARERGKVVMMNADLLGGEESQIHELRNFIPPEVILIDVQEPSDGAAGNATAARSSVLGTSLRGWGRIFPTRETSRQVQSSAASAIRRPNMDGMIASNWAAAGAPLLRAMQYREVAYAAETAWNPGAHVRLPERFDLLYYGLDGPDLLDIERSHERITAGLTFPHVWQHPLHRADSTSVSARQLARASLPRDSSERVITAIEDLQKRVARGGDRLDYDAFAVRFSSWDSETLELASWMREVRAAVRRSDLEEAAERASRLADEARSLGQAFRSLWLRTNREVYLDQVTRMFQYQSAYLERMAGALSDGRVTLATTAPSRYIGTAGGSDVSYLRTTFGLERGEVANAYLQVAGQNDVEVWINGDRIGRIIGAEHADVEVWNVASRLRSGSNDLAVRAARRGAAHGRSATANVYLEIHFEDGRTRLIVSDQGWKASPEASPRWLRDAYSGLDWPRATTAEVAPTLTMPMFDRGLPSRIEARASSASR